MSDSIIKFVPFASAIESPFWVRYFREKLETIQLSEEALPLRLFYTSSALTTEGSSATTPRLQCQDASLILQRPEQSTDTSVLFSNNECVAVEGALLGYNTLESFQKVDKNSLLRSYFGDLFFTPNDDATVLKSLNSALLISFADLKNHSVVLVWYACSPTDTVHHGPNNAGLVRYGYAWSSTRIRGAATTLVGAVSSQWSDTLLYLLSCQADLSAAFPGRVL
jgi:Ubiquitin-like modifier-activating enzyme ATG7 N-terminus